MKTDTYQKVVGFLSIFKVLTGLELASEKEIRGVSTGYSQETTRIKAP
jgi:hypothetical protein